MLKGGVEMKTDPVCGMEVKEDTPYNTLHGGKKMFFCSHDCQQKFIKSPGLYISGEKKEQAGPGKGGIKAA